VKRFVNVVEVIALVCFGLFVVLLFVDQASSPTASPSNTTASAGAPRGGAEIYASLCAGCHGKTGQGSIGPALGQGKAAKNFPNAADEIDIVTNGEGGMPAFGDDLSQDELKAVVEFTRSGL